MKVRLYPGDSKGVGTVRVLLPGQAAQQLGVDIETSNRFEIIRAQNRRTGRWVIKPDPIDADVIVLQRPSNPEIVALIPALQKMGVAVVVDVDDDLHAIQADNAARGAENPRLILKACRLADLVTVSTPALARRYAIHGRVRVLPNCVPAALLDMPRDSDGRTVGWAGWTGSHPGDLDITRGGIQSALEDTGGRFQVIGPSDGVQQALDLRDEPSATGGLPLHAYHQALGQLDVGIAPLADNVFNQSKSGLKVLEMAARGAVVIASPRPDYHRLALEGVCQIAGDRARSWRTRVRELLVDVELRGELVADAQWRIRRRHTYETQGQRWVDAWEDAIALHHEHGPREALAA